MNIRLSKTEDIPRMQEIFEIAKKYMKDSGNPNQWAEPGYPGRLLENDIKNGHSFVIEEDGKIIGTFAFIIGRDSTYDVIEGGAWLDDDAPYGTIHRIASDGSRRHLLEACLDYCFNLIDNIRIDTHEDNKTMQHLVEKNGFKRCGIIYVYDGSPRIAYQKIIRKEEQQ